MQTTRGRGNFNGRGRGRGGRGGGNPRHFKQADTDVLCDVPGCGVYSRDANGLALHKAAKHGAQLQTKDGTPSNYVSTVNNQVRNPPGQGRRSRQQGQTFVAGTYGLGPSQAGPSRLPANTQVSENVGYTPAPPLWVTSAARTSLRQDRVNLKPRSILLSGREVYLLQRKPFTIGNGTGNTLNVLSAAEWRANLMNSATASNIPYPMWEFIGLDIQVHGDFGSHGDFALVYLTVPNGSDGISVSNTAGTTAAPASSARRDQLLAMRWSSSLTRHTIMTGSGNFFVPADGPGSRIQGAAHVNVISGTSVLNANAVLVTVVMNAVFAVTGDRAWSPVPVLAGPGASITAATTSVVRIWGVDFPATPDTVALKIRVDKLESEGPAYTSGALFPELSRSEWIKKFESAPADSWDELDQRIYHSFTDIPKPVEEVPLDDFQRILDSAFVRYRAKRLPLPDVPASISEPSSFASGSVTAYKPCPHDKCVSPSDCPDNIKGQKCYFFYYSDSNVSKSFIPFLLKNGFKKFLPWPNEHPRMFQFVSDASCISISVVDEISEEGFFLIHNNKSFIVASDNSQGLAANGFE
jgi:hypothetical protein